jgi:hypothetical protein
MTLRSVDFKLTLIAAMPLLTFRKTETYCVTVPGLCGEARSGQVQPGGWFPANSGRRRLFLRTRFTLLKGSKSHQAALLS